MCDSVPRPAQRRRHQRQPRRFPRPRASSHSSNTLAWSNVAGKSVRTNPASGLRAKNQRRRSARMEASFPAAKPRDREIPRCIRPAGETCSICKERARFIISSVRKSIGPSRRSFVWAGAPKWEKRLNIAAIRTVVKPKGRSFSAPMCARPKSLTRRGIATPRRGRASQPPSGPARRPVRQACHPRIGHESGPS